MKVLGMIWFYLCNWSSRDRETLRRWKEQGRISKGYCGPLREIAWSVEMEYIAKLAEERAIELAKAILAGDKEQAMLISMGLLQKFIKKGGE